MGMASKRDDKEKGESIVLRRCVTLAVSCCLVLALALLPVDLLFAQDESRKSLPSLPPKPRSHPKETPEDRRDQDWRPGQEHRNGEGRRRQEGCRQDDGARQGGRTATAADSARGPGQDRRGPKGRGGNDRRRSGRGSGRNVDRPATDSRHPDQRPGDGRANPQGPEAAGPTYGVSPEVFGAWFTGYGKMDDINYVERFADHATRARGSSSGTSSGRGSWSSTSRKSARPSRPPPPRRKRRSLPRRNRLSQPRPKRPSRLSQLQSPRRPRRRSQEELRPDVNKPQGVATTSGRGAAENRSAPACRRFLHLWSP